MTKMDDKTNKIIKTVFAIVGVAVAVAAVAFAVYKFITKEKAEEEDCDYTDVFEDEESCIELEFVYPTEAEAVPAEASEEE